MVTDWYGKSLPNTHPCFGHAVANRALVYDTSCYPDEIIIRTINQDYDSGEGSDLSEWG